MTALPTSRGQILEQGGFWLLKVSQLIVKSVGHRERNFLPLQCQNEQWDNIDFPLFSHTCMEYKTKRVGRTLTSLPVSEGPTKRKRMTLDPWKVEKRRKHCCIRLADDLSQEHGRSLNHTIRVHRTRPRVLTASALTLHRGPQLADCKWKSFCGTWQLKWFDLKTIWIG